MATVLIPAKRVSSRVPNKNLLDLGGRPILSWTIEACRRWNFIDEVFVATEDDEIANLAFSEGATVYSITEEDVKDQRTVSSLWKHFVKDKTGPQVLMHCTNPFRKVSEMEEASRLFLEGTSDILISVMKVIHCILDVDGNLNEDDVANRMTTLSQHRTPKYVLDGSYYISTAEYISKCVYFEEGSVIPYPLSAMSTIEIDNMNELELCRSVAACGFDNWWKTHGC